MSSEPPYQKAMSPDDNRLTILPNDMRNHVMEGAHRFHAFKCQKYAFPNDETEQSCQDEIYQATLIVCGGRLHSAPVETLLKKPGSQALDVGTGTGVWACDMGDAYPNAKIVGIDISPIQPEYVPENVMFCIDNFEDGWEEDEGPYDYIHVRNTLEAVRNKERFLSNIYRFLKPGGYVEFQGFNHQPHCDDNSLTPETPYAVRNILKYLDEGLQRFGGQNFNIITKAASMLQKVGFDSISSEMHKLPFGNWPADPTLRTCGRHAQAAFLRGIRGLCERPLGANGLGWEASQLEVYLTTVRRDAKDPNFHTWYPYHVIYGRKPL